VYDLLDRRPDAWYVARGRRARGEHDADQGGALPGMEGA
jgi:hypothetical protein